MKWIKINTLGTKIRYRHGHRSCANEEKSLIYIYGGGNLGICNEMSMYDIEQNYNSLPLMR